MSILIKDMEMPESCDKCRFCVNGFTDEAPMYECGVQSYDNVSVLVESGGKPFDFRPDWCPLIEIPTPHGRMIDADKLKGRLVLHGNSSEQVQLYANICEWIDLQETVIEAEGSEE